MNSKYSGHRHLLDHFPPAAQARWTTIGLRGLGGGVFFIDYRHDMDARRAEFARVLLERQGGPLGIVGVREVTMSPEDVGAVRPAWVRLLGEPPSGDASLWTVGQNDLYRRLGGAERVAILFRLSTLVRETARAGIRRRHPSYVEGQVDLALRRLVLGDDLTRKAFPNDELVDP